jgi:hypothetical protein
LALPDTVMAEVEGRLRSQQKLLGKIVGVMFPTLSGCRTPTELCRVRGWDKHWPSRLLGALPKRSWLKRLRRLGLEVLVPLWRHVETKSPATQSRWQWTWAIDDSVCKKYGQQLALVGRWWSGQHKRVLSGIDGLLLVVVIGDGKLVVPVDLTIRRPDPAGAGAPCRDKLSWTRTMLDERLAALRRRGLALPPPIMVGDSWFSDSPDGYPIDLNRQVGDAIHAGPGGIAQCALGTWRSRADVVSLDSEDRQEERHPLWNRAIACRGVVADCKPHRRACLRVAQLFLCPM